MPTNQDPDHPAAGPAVETATDGGHRTRAGSNYGDHVPAAHRPAPLDPDPGSPTPDPIPSPAPFDPAPLDPDPWAPGMPPTEAAAGSATALPRSDDDLGVDADDPDAPALRAQRDEARGRRISEAERLRGGVGPPRQRPEGRSRR